MFNMVRELLSSFSKKLSVSCTKVMIKKVNFMYSFKSST